LLRRVFIVALLLAGVLLFWQCADNQAPTACSNHAPQLAPVGAQSLIEGDTLCLTIRAVDVDGTVPSLNMIDTLGNSVFADNHDGTGSFCFWPDTSQIGSVVALFVASDGQLADTLAIALNVSEPINRPPVIAYVAPQIVDQDSCLDLDISATDPEGDSISLQLGVSSRNLSLEDHGDGTGLLIFCPDSSQVGTQVVPIIASDGEKADTLIVDLTVEGPRNRPPVIQSISNQRVTETDTLRFTVTATDPEGTIPQLGADFLPANAAFTDNGDGTGSFIFTPTLHQAGDYLPVFTAFDGELLSKLTVPIHVTDTLNQPPEIVDLPETIETWEARCCTLEVRVYDPEGDSLTLQFSSQPKVHYGVERCEADTWCFRLCFYYGDAGTYDLTFIVSDNSSSDLALTRVVVHHSNSAPEIDRISPRYAAAGDTVAFRVHAWDANLTIPALWSYDLPTNATFVDSGTGGGCCTFIPQPGQEGDYLAHFVASDGIAADTTAVEFHVLTLGGPRQDGPIPAAIGNVWRYWIRPGIADRMVAIVGVEPEGDDLWWVLSEPIPPIGDRFMMRGDTVYSKNGPEFLPAHDTTYCYPAPPALLSGDRCVQIIPDCFCSPCVRFFRETVPDMSMHYYLEEYYLCPGVGITHGAYIEPYGGMGTYLTYALELKSYHLR
jgi:hypothetical protein